MDRQAAYKDKIEALEREMGARIEEIKARMDKNMAQYRIDASERINALERRRDEIRERLSAWRESGNELDDHTRKEINKSLAEMEKEMKRASAKLRC